MRSRISFQILLSFSSYLWGTMLCARTTRCWWLIPSNLFLPLNIKSFVNKSCISCMVRWATLNNSLDHPVGPIVHPYKPGKTVEITISCSIWLQQTIQLKIGNAEDFRRNFCLKNKTLRQCNITCCNTPSLRKPFTCS